MKNSTALFLAIATLASLAQAGHRFIASDFSGGRAVVVAADGSIEWEMDGLARIQDSWLLENRNYLFSHRSGVKEVTPEKTIVWEYTAPEGVEIHSVQPIEDGKALACECGTKRLIELDRKGRIVKEIPLQSSDGTHLQFRTARKTPRGTYWVAYIGESNVRELDADGKILREIKVDKEHKRVHGLQELPNGHLLVSTASGCEFKEFNQSGKQVWYFTKDDMKRAGIKYAYAAGVEVLDNGNRLLSLHGGNPQFFEVTPRKEVIWKHYDEKLGRITSISCLESAPFMLQNTGAKVTGDVFPDRGAGLIRNRGNDGDITWNLNLTKPVEDCKVYLEYSSPSPGEKIIEISIPGIIKKGIPVKNTDSWSNPTMELVEKVSLPIGKHQLKLAFTGDGYGVDFHRIVLTQGDFAPILGNYPAVYSKKADWAQSMAAMRKAYSEPEILNCNGQELYLNPKDGQALWTDFPKESDWFLQDNQVHGEWGNGKYDARKDYQHYLDPARDNTLERKLIEQVLPELGDKTAAFKNRLQQLVDQKTSPNDPAWLTLYSEACRIRRSNRLAPLLEKTQKIIYATHMNMGTIYLATETQECGPGSQLRIIDLTPELEGKPLIDELLFDSNNGIVRDPELSFDAKKLLFAWRKVRNGAGTIGRLAPSTGNYKIYEMDLATKEMRPLTDDATYGADFEPCYLPNGDIMFSSARCVHEVTCGWGDCSNLFIMNKDGKYARRVGFDQTQSAFQHLLNDGRVVLTRRDYNDRGQSYAHCLMVMNPDGTTQTEYYGNNSMAPTSLQHTRPIPGTSKSMAVAGGYHTTQGGKLATIDPSRGRQNYDGLTFFNWEPTPLAEVDNENYCRVGEQFTYPYPFDANSLLVSMSPIGAYMTSDNGRLNTRYEQGNMLYKLYYLTLDGRRELLAAHPTLSCTQGIPVAARKRPHIRPSLVDYRKTNGTCYVQNVYYGPSAEGIEPGSIKKLRVVEMLLKPTTIGAGGWRPNSKMVGPGRKYSGYGWHSVLPAGVGSASFDTKEILGEVDVHEDGSAMFEVPARKPIFFQLVDAEGRVVQTMRSWATLMPNENFSCVGCHEENDSAPLPDSMKTMAMQQPPQQLQPAHHFSGKPFSYPQMVQPVWNKHCVSCHAPGKKAEKIDLSATLVKDNQEDRGNSSTRRQFNQSYLTLLKVKWVRHGHLKNKRLDEGRPNKRVDYYTRMATVELTPPYYSGSTKSGLIDMMLKEHKGVKLTPEEIGVVAAWIDLNVPYVGEYDEMNIWDDKAKKLYAEKMAMRDKQEAIEAENIRQYIEDGQP